MKWDDYYEKINDWAVSTAVSKISSLEDMGSSDEVTEALNIIAFDDEKGATRLLNKAIQFGVKFTGENLSEIQGICAEEGFQKALCLSADNFTSKDLEDLYGCVDDETLVGIAKRYHLSVPEIMADEYEEVLCEDTTMPISWKRFYDGFYEWSPEYAKARLRSVTDFGSEDEVLEVVQELFWDDEYEASQFVMKVLDAGVRFTDENLVELTTHCNEDTVKQAVFLSRLLLTEDSLEELYGNVSDDIIVEVAKQQNLKLPEDLREEEEETEDISVEIHSAIASAEYALDCLVQAHNVLSQSSSVSVLDMLTTGFFTSFLKRNTVVPSGGNTISIE